MDTVTIATWVGIAACLSQSAMFSGLNLAVFSVSRLRLEADAPHDPRAARLLALRHDANRLLTTILWGNVSVNTLLALLSGSVLTGVTAFLLSTLLITLFGEILPQAWFSRRALDVASRCAPLLRLYSWLLAPLAIPSARLLDRLVGPEQVVLLRERTLRGILVQHLRGRPGEISGVEAAGALNFLDLDDRVALTEAVPVAADSILTLPHGNDGPIWPAFSPVPGDAFVQQVQRSGKKWVVVADPAGEPHLVLNADEFLRELFMQGAALDPGRFSHRPLLFRDPATPLGHVLEALQARHTGGDRRPLRDDVALLWHAGQRALLTGSDLLADLLARQPQHV